VAILIAMLGGGIAAGTFGSLLGLGGGILIVPLLTLGFGLPLREAVGASLVSVIMTSSAAASVYLERHIANMRLGMTLELFTAFGALVGGLVAFLLDEQVLAGLFTILLLYTAWSMARPPRTMASGMDDEALPEPDGSFVSTLGGPGYRVHRLGIGTVAAVGAGIVSALLGIGGGLVKVPVMNLLMGVPLRVATATSNFMIGVTASAGAIVYLLRGGIDPYVAGPTAVGVFIGASIGARVAHRVDTRVLRGLFVAVLLFTAFEMARKALGI
jgi:uncharacterized membrane protein YfcA